MTSNVSDLSFLNEFMFSKINEPKYFSLHNSCDLLRERELDNELKNRANIEETRIKLESKNRQNSSKLTSDKSNIKNKPTKESHIIIRDENKLFWAFYIFKHSFEDYLLLVNKFKVEQDYKINSIIKVRDHKNELKIHKIKRNFIEDELLNEKRISIKTLNCLALIYKLNIIYVKGRTYYIMNYDDETEKGIYSCENIIGDKNGQISILKMTPEITKNILDTYYHIENIEKPINAFSSYKAQDLNELAEKLGIETSKNGKQKFKKDLYTDISSVFL